MPSRKGGKRGPAFVATKPEESLTVRYIAGAVSRECRSDNLP